MKKLAIVALFAACVAKSPVTSPPESFQPIRTAEITAVRYSGSGELWYVESSDEGCRIVNSVTSASQSVAIDDCSAPRFFVLPDATKIVSDGVTSQWILDGSASVREPVLDATSTSNYIYLDAGGDAKWKSGSGELLIGRIQEARILPSAQRVIALRNDRHELVSVAKDGVLTLFSSEKRIDSFDVDPKGNEVVFSAFRNGNYDVGLVAVHGGEVNWIGPEATNEYQVTWAPRGNKITYIVNQHGGTTLRSVHIPTGYQVAADFPGLDVTAIAWEPSAERYAVIASSLVESSHIESIRYGGEDRKVVVPAKLKSLNEIETLVSGGIPYVIATPPNLRYGERYPLLVQRRVSSFLGWSDTIAAALVTGRWGAVSTPPGSVISDEFRKELASIAWVDESRITVVDEKPRE